MKKCLANNWNEDWIPVLKRAANYMLSLFHHVTESPDELINDAWLNSVRRLPKDTPEKMVFSCACRSMAQYVVGKRDSRHGKNKKFHAKMVSIYQDTDNDFEFIEKFEDHQFSNCPGITYDDVDELVSFLRREPERVIVIVCGVLYGKTRQELSVQLKMTPARVCQIFKDFTRKAKNENKKSIAS